MKSKYLMILGVTIFIFVFLANNTYAQDPSSEAAMSMLKDFFADPAARADYASKNPEALQAEKNLSQFPPKI
jgi:F0F1-type ATP synthase membrane subunit a